MSRKYKKYMTQSELDGKRRLAQNTIAIVITIVLLGLAFIVSSCKTPCSIAETQTTDSVLIEVHTRDTAIITKADSASIRALLHCDSAYNVVVDELTTLQGERIKADSHAQQTNGGLLLSMDCKEDSLINIIHLRDSTIKELKKRIITQSVEIEKKGSAFWKGSGIAFWVLLGLVVLAGCIGLIIKFAK